MQAALRRAAAGLGNLGGLMRTLANQQFRSTLRNFQTESFDGVKWRRLADSTANRKLVPGGPRRRRSRTSDVVRGRGQLRGGANILHPSGRHLMMTIHQSHTSEEARVSTPNPWAFVHNFGAPLPHFQMPRRTFMGFSEQDNRDILTACHDYLRRSVLP